MTRNDFRIAMLLRLGRIKYNDFAAIDKVFAKMDTNQSGDVTQVEIVGVNEDAMVHRMERMGERWLEALPQTQQQRQQEEKASGGGDKEED